MIMISGASLCVRRAAAMAREVIKTEKEQHHQILLLTCVDQNESESRFDQTKVTILPFVEHSHPARISITKYNKVVRLR